MSYGEHEQDSFVLESDSNSCSFHQPTKRNSDWVREHHDGLQKSSMYRNRTYTRDVLLGINNVEYLTLIYMVLKLL